MREPVFGLAKGLEEASRYFMGHADVQRAAQRIAARWDELGIEYAIAGGLALLTGTYPGDDNPTDLAFSSPRDVSVDEAGIKFLSLRSLVELKIASGLTAPDRLQDLADVIELIRVNGLDEEFVSQLHASVHEKFTELWGYAQRPTGEYCGREPDDIRRFTCVPGGRSDLTSVFGVMTAGPSLQSRESPPTGLGSARRTP